MRRAVKGYYKGYFACSLANIDLNTSIQEDPTFSSGSTVYSRRTEAYWTIHCIWTGALCIHGCQYSTHCVTSRVAARKRLCLQLVLLHSNGNKIAVFPRPRISACSG